MKRTIACFSIVLILGFGACSTAPLAPKKVNLSSCTPGDSGKIVILNDSFAPEGRVVRLAH